MAILTFDTEKEKFSITWDHTTEDFVRTTERLVCLCTGKYNKNLKESILNFGISSLNGDVERAQLILEMFNAYISAEKNDVFGDEEDLVLSEERELEDDMDDVIVPPEQSFDGVKE